MVKLRPSVPYNLELALTGKYGFSFVKREHEKYVMFYKNYISDSDGDELPFTPTVVPINKTSLLKRCDNIVLFYPDPYAVDPKVVRTRLHNMMQGLKSLAERQFVLEYMDENFPLDDVA